MAVSGYSNAVEIARDYYNSGDADNFYFSVWGGEDIHIGMYESEDEPIFSASRRTVAYLASRLDGLKDGVRVLDIGSGYGGAARYLARTYGCRVTAVNLSEVENKRHRETNQEQGLADLIDVVDGSFENLPSPDASFEVVWSQDAILHSGDRERVLAEVARVLRPGGQFVFTDPMQADDCPQGVLQPILDRIHLKTLGSPQFYLETAAHLELEDLNYEDMTSHLVTHYARVLEETEHQTTRLKVSENYIERMKKGLGHWIEGGKNGHLAWGVFLFQKRP